MVGPLIRMLPGGIPGASNWEKTPGHTKNTQEGLHIPSGLGKSQHPPGRAKESVKGEENVGYIAWPAKIATQSH